MTDIDPEVKRLWQPIADYRGEHTQAFMDLMSALSEGDSEKARLITANIDNIEKRARAACQEARKYALEHFRYHDPNQNAPFQPETNPAGL